MLAFDTTGQGRSALFERFTYHASNKGE